MKTTLNLCCLLLISSSILFAQDNVKELIASPDILWAAEIMSDLNPDKTKKENREYKISCMSDFIKLSSTPLRPNSEIYPLGEGESHTLTHKIFNKEYLANSTVYSNSDLSTALTDKEKSKLLSYIDTIKIFDSVTKKTSKLVTVKIFDSKDVLFYRIKQLIYYNKKDTMFQAFPIAIAPVIGVFDDKGVRTGYAPLFWIDLSSINKTDLNNNDLNWIKRTAYSTSLEGEMKIVKETQPLPSVQKTFFDNLIKNSDKSLVYNVFATLGNGLYTPSEIKSLRNSIDTIITFDPITFEEIVTTKASPFEEDFKQLRFVQDWIWDNKKQQLSIRFLGFSPIINRYDDNGNFLNSGPLFYRRDKNLK